MRKASKRKVQHLQHSSNRNVNIVTVNTGSKRQRTGASRSAPRRQEAEPARPMIISVPGPSFIPGPSANPAPPMTSVTISNPAPSFISPTSRRQDPSPIDIIGDKLLDLGGIALQGLIFGKLLGMGAGTAAAEAEAAATTEAAEGQALGRGPAGVGGATALADERLSANAAAAADADVQFTEREQQILAQIQEDLPPLEQVTPPRRITEHGSTTLVDIPIPTLVPYPSQRQLATPGPGFFTPGPAPLTREAVQRTLNERPMTLGGAIRRGWSSVKRSVKNFFRGGGTPGVELAELKQPLLFDDSPHDQQGKVQRRRSSRYTTTPTYARMYDSPPQSTPNYYKHPDGSMSNYFRIDAPLNLDPDL